MRYAVFMLVLLMSLGIAQAQTPLPDLKAKPLGKDVRVALCMWRGDPAGRAAMTDLAVRLERINTLLEVQMLGGGGYGGSGAQGSTDTATLIGIQQILSNQGMLLAAIAENRANTVQDLAPQLRAIQDALIRLEGRYPQPRPTPYPVGPYGAGEFPGVCPGCAPLMQPYPYPAMKTDKATTTVTTYPKRR